MIVLRGHKTVHGQQLLFYEPQLEPREFGGAYALNDVSLKDLIDPAQLFAPLIRSWCWTRRRWHRKVKCYRDAEEFNERNANMAALETIETLEQATGKYKYGFVTISRAIKRQRVWMKISSGLFRPKRMSRNGC